jgi:hypothetical protein
MYLPNEFFHKILDLPPICAQVKERRPQSAKAAAQLARAIRAVQQHVPPSNAGSRIATKVG